VISVPANRATRLGFNILVLLGAVVALRLGQSVFIPTIIALLLAAVLGPGAYWLHHRLRFRWTVACVTVVTLLVFLNLAITLVPARASARILQVLPQTNDDEKTQKLYQSFRASLEQISPVPLDDEMFPKEPAEFSKSGFFKWMTKTVQDSAPEAIRQVVWYGCSWFWQWILIMFILLFLLLEGRMLTRRLVEVFGPSQEVRDKVGYALADMARQVRTYLVWRTIINFWLAIVVGAVFHIAGLSHPWTWAIILAVLNYVPYIGPIIAGIPPLVDAFLSVSPLAGLFILIIYTTIIVVEGYLIVPVLMGRSMELNATTVMLACLFWELVWGTMGLFLAMPLMAGIRAVCYHVPEWRPWANLMGISEEEPQPVTLDMTNGAALPESRPAETEIRAASGGR